MLACLPQVSAGGGAEHPSPCRTACNRFARKGGLCCRRYTCRHKLPRLKRQIISHGYVSPLNAQLSSLTASNILLGLSQKMMETVQKRNKEIPLHYSTRADEEIKRLILLTIKLKEGGGCLLCGLGCD